MPKVLVHTIEKIDEYWQKHGSKAGHVEGKSDWKVVLFAWELFRISYPEDVKIFVETQRRVKQALKHEHGIVKEPNIMQQHVMNMPQKLYQLINTFYPNQKWDRDFVRELAERLPVLKVPKGHVK